MKLIATDLDGTLLNSNHEVSSENIKALKLALKKGDEVTIATGRTYADAKSVCKKAGLNVHIISNNGSFVHSKDGQLLKASTLNKEKVRKILQWLQDKDYYYDIATDRNSFIPFNTKSILKKDFQKAKSIDQSLNVDSLHYLISLIFSQDGLKITNSIDDIIDANLDYSKITINSFDKVKLLKAKNFFIKDKNLSVVSSDPLNFEIINANASKGSSLEYLADYLNIDLKDVAAIGDNYNDVSMFEKAGISIAMGNANDDIKKKCMYVSNINDLNGVAYAINEFIYEVEAEASPA